MFCVKPRGTKGLCVCVLLDFPVARTSQLVLEGMSREYRNQQLTCCALRGSLPVVVTPSTVPKAFIRHAKNCILVTRAWYSEVEDGSDLPLFDEVILPAWRPEGTSFPTTVFRSLSDSARSFPTPSY